MNGDIEMKDDTVEKVAILDAGAQYGKVIDRRIRELLIHSVILPLDTPLEEIIKRNIKAIVISGGPGSVYDKGAPGWDKALLTSEIPILGICYGMQLINRDSGGVVESSDSREDGQFKITVDPKSHLYSGLDVDQEVLLTHLDTCKAVGAGFNVTATHGEAVVGIEDPSKKIYGVQYHPEVDLTINGVAILKNFLIDIAGCQQTFTLKSRLQSCIDEIKSYVGTSCKILSLVSGGVDSAVCTALLHKAIGSERVIAVHINNGFLRKDESEQVKESLEAVGLKLTVFNESHCFFHGTTRIPSKRGQNEVNIEVGPLHSVIHPEEKRKIIGDTFMKVSNKIMEELKLDSETTILAQGTLRPDLIESASHLASGNATTIKTHHNDSQLVRELREKGRVVEPLKDFHKDEVRLLGKELGLPDSILQRHPFPGPGLAIRVICAEEKYTCKDFSEESNLLGFIVSYASALKKPHPLLHRIQNGLADSDIETLKSISSKCNFTSTLLPIKTVGVQGDCRTYRYVAALSSEDDNPCWASLVKLAKIIPKLCPVNRVAYVFGGPLKYPIQEVTFTTLTSNVLSTLRQVDHLANQVLIDRGIMGTITQMPVILLPLHFDIDPVSRLPYCQRSVVIRPFLTNDFMTGVAAQPGKDIAMEHVLEMVSKIKSVAGISRVLYDLTSKPPGTTEWE